MVKNTQTFAEVMPKLKSVPHEHVVSNYNADFDRGMVVNRTSGSGTQGVRDSLL
jgi:hypothetical protein